MTISLDLLYSAYAYKITTFTIKSGIDNYIYPSDITIETRLKNTIKPAQLNLSDDCKFLHLIFKKYIDDNITQLKNTLFIRNISKHYSIKYAWLYYSFIPRFDITAPDRDHAKKNCGTITRRIGIIPFQNYK